MRVIFLARRYRRTSQSFSEIFFWFAVLLVILIGKKRLVVNNISLKAFPIQFVYEIAGALLLLVVIRVLVNQIFKWHKRNKYINSGISTVDNMKGNEFEKFLLAHFEKLGYKGKLTKESNDYGADILLQKDNETIVVQAKRYGSKVGIKAIQELVASLQYYKASKGIVITNNYYTNNAFNLAKANNIELWDRPQLIDIMTKNGSKELASQTFSKTMESKVCPECGSNLVLRNGSHGKFFGCTNFPKCHFIRNSF